MTMTMINHRPSNSSSTSHLTSFQTSSSSIPVKSKRSSLLALRQLAVLFIGGCLIFFQNPRYVVVASDNDTTANNDAEIVQESSNHNNNKEYRNDMMEMERPLLTDDGNEEEETPPLIIEELQSPATEDNRVAICAIQKGGLRYLDEWVQYHINAMGFDSIYLYDNSDEFELQGWYQSLDQNLQRKIRIRHFPGIKRQNEAYTHCAKTSALARGWIAFIDIDEFVVLRNHTKYPYIGDLLQSLPPRYGGLAMNWLRIYMNNQTHYQDLPVTLRFQNRSQHALDPRIKTIARAKFVIEARHAHVVRYSSSSFNTHNTHDTRGNRIDGPRNQAMVDDDIVLFHYHSKSLEEFKERCSRGRADVPKEMWASHLSCESDSEIIRKMGREPELIKDDAPWQLLKERVPNYANKYR